MEQTNVKVLERALILLEELIASGTALGVNELAKRCEMSPATAFRLMQTLKAHNFVRQDSEDKYQPGRMLTFIAAERSLHMTLRDVAELEMARLTSEEGEAMNLAVREGNICYILGQSRTSRIVDYVPPVGTKLPFHASACGKLLLATMPEELRARFLDSLELTKMTDKTILEREELESELSQIRAQGFALDKHESQTEGFCIAVPIYGSGEEPIAALSFSGFIGKRTVSEIDRYVRILKDASARISRAL